MAGSIPKQLSQIHPEIDAGMVFGTVNTQVRRFLLLVFPDPFAIERWKTRYCAPVKVLR
ncbi:MAG: hypothetical protein IPH35_00720 [Rhodoferax sp.]|nr:hypothetical protein [Rhodoferax sp.]